jgi:hypothetical protein
VLALFVVVASVMLFAQFRGGDDDASRPPDDVRKARRPRQAAGLPAETTARWLVAMREQEERASAARREAARP